MIIEQNSNIKANITMFELLNTNLLHCKFVSDRDNTCKCSVLDDIEVKPNILRMYTTFSVITSEKIH